MMKYFGFLLFVGVVLILAILFTAVNFMPDSASDQSVIVVPVNPTITYLEADLAEREADYQTQLSNLEQTLQQHQADFETQSRELNRQIATAQAQLDTLTSQKEDLQAQVEQLEITRTEHLGTYQTQLEAVRREYTARQTKLQAELDEARAKLNEAGAQPGHE
jgi:chromosome segregation ATPase